MDAQTLIEKLRLTPHHEGGWYRRTFEAGHRNKVDTEFGPRFTMTSIFYMLTGDSPRGRWHICRSDILHFWQMGSPLQYDLLHRDGHHERVILGPDLDAGQRLMFAVPGGVWKGTRLLGRDFGLLSEAVAPGFEYEDMRLAKAGELERLFPQQLDVIGSVD